MPRGRPLAEVDRPLLNGPREHSGPPFKQRAATSAVTCGLPWDTSETEPALSSKAPVDPPTRHHCADNLMTELLFQGRTPGHQLETEAIIDHREPA